MVALDVAHEKHDARGLSEIEAVFAIVGFCRRGKACTEDAAGQQARLDH
jgi:hypothetical protein